MGVYMLHVVLCSHSCEIGHKEVQEGNVSRGDSFLLVLASLVVLVKIDFPFSLSLPPSRFLVMHFAYYFYYDHHTRRKSNPRRDVIQRLTFLYSRWWQSNYWRSWLRKLWGRVLSGRLSEGERRSVVRQHLPCCTLWRNVFFFFL